MKIRNWQGTDGQIVILKMISAFRKSRIYGKLIANAVTREGRRN